MHGTDNTDDHTFSDLTPLQCDILLTTFILSRSYRTKEDDAVLTEAIARALIQIAMETKDRLHAHFLTMMARLFDPKLPVDQITDYSDFFIRAERRKVRLVMATKGHPKHHHIDDKAIPRTARGTPKAEAIAQMLSVSLRQAYRIKASQKRGRKRN